MYPAQAQRCTNDNPKICALFLTKTHKSDMDERMLDIHQQQSTIHNIAENFLSLFIIIFQECAIKQSNHHRLPLPFILSNINEKNPSTVYFEQSPTINHFLWKTTQWLKRKTHRLLFYYSHSTTYIYTLKL